MPWCPKCKEEYREGFALCGRCGTPLVGGLADDIEEDEMPQDTEWVLLKSMPDELEADLAESLLAAEGIPVVRRYRDDGEIMRLYTGRSRYGIDIFVPAESFELAAALLNAQPEEMPGAPDDNR